MDYEILFSATGIVAMAGWLILLASSFLPAWTIRIVGEGIPASLSLGYIVLITSAPPDSGGFGSFAEVRELFSHQQAVMAGWVHFLAFDLFVGGWICRTARAEQIRFWLVLLCLPVTFLFGPAGYLCFQIIRGLVARGPFRQTA